MPEIKVTPLGAGQDVGRSCVLVSIAGKNVMLDCGMHMGYNDDVRWLSSRRIAEWLGLEGTPRIIKFHPLPPTTGRATNLQIWC